MASIRSFGVERIGALSDGVVAIAITLLVLEIKIPEQAASDAVLWLNLQDQAPELIAWMISFVIIALIWYDQHYLFAHSDRVDSGFLLTNLLQLGAVSLIPIASHLIGRYPDDALSAALFSAIMLANGAVMAVNALYLSRHTALHGSAAARFLHHRAAYHVVSFALTALVAMAAAVLYDPLLGTAVWAVKPVSFAFYHAAYNRFLDSVATSLAPGEGT